MKINLDWIQRFLFFFSGFILATTCGFALFYWLDLFRWLTSDPKLIFDTQPSWLKVANHITGWLPWVAVAVVLILRFVKGRQVKTGFFFLGTITPYVLLIGYLFFAPVVEDHLNRLPFDSNIWKKGNENEIRIRMVDDLLYHHKLDGMTRSEVVSLIGEPDVTDYFKEYDMVYRLGMERGFISIDSEWLVFRLNATDVVIEHNIVRD